MTAIATSPFPIYLDVDGSALENGYLYFGVAGQNPETNPITVYWDSTFQTPAAQPIRTSGGYAVRNGSPAMVYFSATDYSITVRDNNRRLVYSKLSTDNAAAQQLELPVADVFTGNGATTVYTLSKTPSGQASLHVSIGGVTQTPGVDYTLTNGSKILTFTSAPPSGTTIVVLYGQSSEALSQISYTIQASIATAGQTVFNLTNQYTPGANTLAVYLNGLRLTVVADYAETSTSSITLTAGAVAGDELLFVTGSTEINPVSITASAVAYTPAGTGAVATDVQSKLRESVSVKDFGAIGNGIADDWAALNAAFTYASTIGILKSVYIPTGDYRVGQTLEIPHNLRVFGDGAKNTRIKPTATFTPAVESYLVKVKQNTGAFGADNNFFCNWSDFTIDALYRTNLGCLMFNSGGGSTLERMFIINGGSGADQVRFSSDVAPNNSAIVATTARSIWFGTVAKASLVCRNGIILNGCYSFLFDNCIFDYLSRDVAGTDGFAVKVLNSAGVTFCSFNAEGNPKPFYSNSSGWQLIGGSTYREGLGSPPSTNPDFAITVESAETQMPNIVGTRITNGYLSAYGGGIARIYGGASLLIEPSGNGEFNYMNSRSTYIQGTVQKGIKFGNVISSDTTTLDYYEELSFTPVVYGTTAAGTATYTTQYGRATRVGRVVHYDIGVTFTGHTGTGNMRISGIPYTAANIGNYRSIASVGASDLTYTDTLQAYIVGLTNFVILATFSSGGATTALPMDAAATLYISGAFVV